MIVKKSITETVKKCLFGEEYLNVFAEMLAGINQRNICIQRQNYITLNLCYQMLLELSKLGMFPVKTLEVNQKFINEYLNIAKKEAEEVYN